MKTILEEYGLLIVVVVTFIIIAIVFPEFRMVLDKIGQFFITGIGG